MGERVIVVVYCFEGGGKRGVGFDLGGDEVLFYGLEFEGWGGGVVLFLWFI